MKLLIKATLGVLIFCLVGVGGVVAQRNWRHTTLHETLKIDEDCAFDCWFGIRPNGSVYWREVEKKVTAAGAGDVRFRGSLMRVTLPLPDSPAAQFQIRFDEGNADQMCLFTLRFSLGEVVATFGQPQYLWLNTQTQRFLLSVNDLYTIEYRLAYESPAIMVSGTLEVPFEDERFSLSFDTPVSQICTSAISDERPAIDPGELQWRGFSAPVIEFQSFPYIEPSTSGFEFN